MMNIVGTLMSFLLLIFVVASLMALPTMWLINYLFSASALMAVFGTECISFWQAVCLNFLCALLFQSPSKSNK